MPSPNRPLSPHVRIYRFPLTGMLSGSHRITGAILSIGTLLLAYWIVSAGYGPEQFERAQALLGSWIGQVALLGWSWALFFHMCNGIRHLLWDMGYILEKDQLVVTSWIALGGSVAMTAATWIAAYLMV